MKRKKYGKYAKHAYKVMELEGSNEPLNPPKLRPCRECGKNSVNYYRCGTCKAQNRYLIKNGQTECYSEILWGVNI